jgi:hypothetical protein
VLLGDQPLDAVGEQRSGVGGIGVRTGPGEDEVLLVLERLARRPVGDPVLLVLVELLDALENHDQDSQPAGREHVIRWFEPVSGTTFVYDYVSGNWSEDNRWQHGDWARLPIQAYMESGDRAYVGDFDPTGKVYEWSDEIFDDDGVLQIGVLEPISLAPKTGMTFYSMDIEELPAGFSGSMIIDVVGDSGGLVSVLNNVNYAVDGDGSTAYTPVTFSQPVAIEDPGPPAPPVIPYYGQ